MNGEWDMPGDEQAGSLPAFGRQLRQQYGKAMAGLDDGMLALLEKLFEIPGVSGVAVADEHASS